MVKQRIAILALLGLAILVTQAVAEEKSSLKSGPQVGERIPGPFHPLNCTGAKAGEKNCLVCQNGPNPVAMIFAREISEPLTKLIKKLDAATGQNTDKRMGSFVVFLSDDESLPSKLKELAKNEKLENIVLSIDNPAGPEKYNVARDADVTVVLYTQSTVKANHAFKKGQLKDTNVQTICADVPKILTQS
jgi:hypothetical protein